MKRSTLFILFMLGLLFLPSFAKAQVEHELLRRVVVFPLKVETTPASPRSEAGRESGQRSGQDLNHEPGRDFTAGVTAQAADETWWQVREELTESRRFLVASKQFLVRSEAFQARGELRPADAILLGRLLDAHALVTTLLRDKALEMRIYDGGNGSLLWTNALRLNPSLTVVDQLPSAGRKLIRDFVASIPYQGFQVIDPLIGKAIFEEGDVQLAQVDIGLNTKAESGDPVQWVRIMAVNPNPLFQGGSRMTVFAEGRVVKVEQGIATVEILRLTRPDEIKEFALVRLPRETERLRTEYLISDNVLGKIGAELISPEIAPAAQFRRENRPLATTLSWLGSLAAVLLLAF